MNILLTSAGRRSYLVKFFKQALINKGLVHASNSTYSTALAVADKAAISPLIYDDDYIEYLLDYCIENDIIAIVSLFDVDLPILSKNVGVFMDKGIKVIVSNPSIINTCNDKWKTFNFAQSIGIKAPKTFLSFISVEDELAKGHLSFPLIIKPRWGMGSIGLYIAEDMEDLKFYYNKAKKDIVKSYLFYESKIDLENSVLIQQKIEGSEYGLDIINSLEKKYITTFVKRKIAMRAGETDIAITENNQVLRDTGKTISLFLNHTGILDVDVIVNNGEPYLLEMNNRFGGGYPFSHLAGANIPSAYISWLENKIPTQNCFEIKYDVLGMKDINILEYRVSNK